jgi:hypothetical protein
MSGSIVRLILLLNALFATSALPAQNWRRLTTLPNTLNEASGMAILSPDSIWWLNDGENQASLYCTNHKARIIDSLPLPLTNTDWEELTYDDSGHVYIGDFGNNSHKRRDLAIHKVHFATKTLILTIQFKYPDQMEFPPKDYSNRNYDCEAMVWQNGKLHLFSKRHWGGNVWISNHYILDDHTPQQTATLTGTLTINKQCITGAALSPDGKELAITSYLFKKHGKIYLGKSYLRIYDWKAFQAGQAVLLKKRRLRGWITARQIESVAYLNSKTLLVASERTRVHKPRVKKVKR